MTIDLSQYKDDELFAMRRNAYIMMAPNLPFGADGYKAHYHGIFNNTMPSFVWDWIQEFFEQYNKGIRRFLVKAHRGSTKSTTFTVGMATYWLARKPISGILVVQKSDVAGGNTSQSIAGIIKENQGWKQMYPTLVPDEEKGWGFNGYEIKDTGDYGAWRQAVIENRFKDPSFVGLGWSSGAIVGMHPNLLLIDDIHDNENTRSDREMAGVRDSVKSNILQTLNRPPELALARNEEPTNIVSYTPWRKTDTYAYLESTGLYYQMETPLIHEDPNGFEWRGKKWAVSWGNIKNPVKFVEDKVKEFGERDFAIMQMLDLSAAEGINLKREWLHTFPHEKIDPSWPVYFGVDYASSADKQKEDKHNYFALAWGRGIPMGGIVLTGGYYGKISSGEAEIKIKEFYEQYHALMIGFEKLGKGYDTMWNLIHSGLPIVPCPKAGEAKKPKGETYEGKGGLAPTFQYSRAWISDIQDDFIKKFTDDWLSWPNGETDTLDAVYWMLYVAQQHLVPIQTENLGERKERKPFGSAWNSLGKVRS